jgi:hypothetical protein
MAFAVRITGQPKDPGAPVFRMEPPWWPARELREDPRFREAENGGYLDYQADLSLPEARALHERFRPLAGRGAFADADWQKIIRPLLEELVLVFGPRAEEFSYFRVAVFEWESGM